MACRPSRARRCSSSSLNRGPPSGDTVHRHARGAPGIRLGRLRGPGHASDGPRGARADRAGDRGTGADGRGDDRPHGLHRRRLYRLLMRRRDRGEAVARPASGARAVGDHGRASRSDRAGPVRPRPRGADRAAGRDSGGPRGGRGGGRAAGRARRPTLCGAHARRQLRPDARVKRRLGFSTRAIHGDPEVRPDWAPVVTPLYQSSTFTNPVGSTAEVRYTRYGNNPNQLTIAKRLALLEGAEAAIFVASGMGAIALAHLAVLRPGDHLLSSEWIYGGVHRLFAQEFVRLGIEVTFVNPLESRTWKRAVRKTTRAIFVETPTNPLLRVVDLEPLKILGQSEGLAVIVDSTFATPINFRPLEHGADVVIHSATKYLNGHSDVIAGAVVGSESVVEEVRKLMQVWGQALDPMAAWLVERGMKTLVVRVERHNQTALAVAQWCSQQPQFAAVHFPGLPGHKDHEVAKRILNGFGGMLGVELKGGTRASARFLRALTIAAHAPSLGGVETLVSEPRLTSHAMLAPEARARAGIPDGFLRFSIGLEDADDIVADLAQALAQL